jgi:hypothetical protein
MMVDHLANALKMNRIVIILLDEEDEKVTHFVVGGDGVEHVVHVAYEELMEGLTGWVLQHREPVLSTWQKNPTNARAKQCKNVAKKLL